MRFLIEEQKNADSQFNWHLKRRQPCIHVKYSRWSNRAMLFGLLVSISLIHFLIAFDYMRTNRDSNLLGRNEIPMPCIFQNKNSRIVKVYGVDRPMICSEFQMIFNTDSNVGTFVFQSTSMDLCCFCSE